MRYAFFLTGSLAYSGILLYQCAYAADVLRRSNDEAIVLSEPQGNSSFKIYLKHVVDEVVA